MLSSVFLSKRKLKAKYETKEKIFCIFWYFKCLLLICFFFYGAAIFGGEYFTDNFDTPE